MNYLKGQSCEATSCSLRHKSECKYWKLGFCFRGNGCAYLHRNIFRVSKSEGDEIAKEVGKEMETDKAQVRNTTDDITSFEHKKVKEENEYLKKQIAKLRDRNLKLDWKVMENTKLEEDEMKAFKDKNAKMLARLKEEVFKRIMLETEIEHLKKRLGDELTDSESESN